MNTKILSLGITLIASAAFASSDTGTPIGTPLTGGVLMKDGIVYPYYSTGGAGLTYAPSTKTWVAATPAATPAPTPAAPSYNEYGYDANGMSEDGRYSANGVNAAQGYFNGAWYNGGYAKPGLNASGTGYSATDSAFYVNGTAMDGLNSDGTGYNANSWRFYVNGAQAPSLNPSGNGWIGGSYWNAGADTASPYNLDGQPDWATNNYLYDNWGTGYNANGFNSEGFNWMREWSPDGDQIAYGSHSGCWWSRGYVVNGLDGTGTGWSPDWGGTFVNGIPSSPTTADLNYNGQVGNGWYNGTWWSGGVNSNSAYNPDTGLDADGNPAP